MGSKSILISSSLRPGRPHLAWLFGCLLLAGCSTVAPDLALIHRLKNRGPVALSSENPYLAANLLLSNEMEKSPELAGFVQHRGAPAALEVEKGLFGPLALHLFYPENGEEYVMETLEGGWFIRGPQAVPPDKLAQVMQLTANRKGQSALLPPAPEPAAEPLEGSTIPATAEPAKNDGETPPSGTGSSIATPSRTASFRSPTPAEGENTARIEAIIESSPQIPAELTPKGDLVHYVTYTGETLSVIARWYTKDRTNAGRLARINKLPNPNHLGIGDIVIIPSYLVKNSNQLPEQAIKELKKLGLESR